MAYDTLFVFVLVGRSLPIILLMVGLLGLIRYRTLTPELRWLVGVIWFGLAMELVSQTLTKLYHTNLWLIPIDAAVELWLLSVVFARALHSPAFTRVRPWLAVAFMGYAALSSGLTIQFSRSAAKFQPVLQVVESLMILGMAALYFRKLLNDLQVQVLARDPMFWVSAGLVIYSLSKLLIALFSNYLLEHYSQQLSLLVWTINGLLTIVLYLCYLRALWLRPQK
jgi:hypothetical protein